MASCCQGSPKKGPMGDVAGVTSCRPAMLQRGGGEGGRGSSRCPPYLISSSSSVQKFTGRETRRRVKAPGISRWASALPPQGMPNGSIALQS